MKFAIFIKTWVKDYIWLRYLLRSIKKFVVPNFDFITIITDEGFPLTDVPEEINGKPVEIKYVKLPENKNHPCPVGIGYVWAQCIKLNWDKYCNADVILQIDSDSMFTKHIDILEAYKSGENWKWWIRKWTDDDGIVQKPATDKFINKDCRYDYMPQQSWIFTKEAIIGFRDFVQHTHGCTIETYLLEKSIPYWKGTMIHKKRTLQNWGSCEYEIFGAYLDYVNMHNYTFTLLPDSGDYLPIKQSWSWGGLTNEDKEYRESILD